METWGSRNRRMLREWYFGNVETKDEEEETGKIGKDKSKLRNNEKEKEEVKRDEGHRKGR